MNKRQHSHTSLEVIQALQQIARLESSGNIDEAQLAYERLLKQETQCAEAWHGLGLLILNKGELGRAAELVGKAVLLDPHQALFQRNFCELCRRLGLLDQALHSGLAAIKLAPKDLEAHFNLGLSYFDLGHHSKAIQSYRKCLKLNSGHAQSWNNLGLALELKGDVKGALNAYQQATKFDPNNAEAKYNQGVLHVKHGDIDNAIKCFNLAIAVKIGFVECHYSLSMLKTYTLDDPHLKMLEEIYPHQAHLKDYARIQYHFALGKALEDVGQFDRAFAAYDEGNRIQCALLSANDIEAEELATQIKTLFTKEFFEARQDWGGSDQSPIFIVGMPGSGTTLVEQILSNYQSVYSAGDGAGFSQAVYCVTKLKSKQLFTEKVNQLNSAQLKKIGNQYVKSTWQADPQGSLMPDGVPVNHLYLGLIHLAFPNAKIIHVMRDPMDACFSCYTRLFRGSMAMTFDLETLGRYCVRYIKLMEHWQAVLPKGRIFNLHYEELVSDAEMLTKRICDFLGLPWDERILEFDKNKPAAKAKSLALINKPIYNTSVGRWRRFARHLKPLISLIKDHRLGDDYPNEEDYITLQTLAPTSSNLGADLIEHCLGLQSKGLHEEVVQPGATK